jgi:hypothetical protein
MHHSAPLSKALWAEARAYFDRRRDLAQRILSRMRQVRHWRRARARACVCVCVCVCWFAVLCCAVLCCAVLCCAVLCCAVLCVCAYMCAFAWQRGVQGRPFAALCVCVTLSGDVRTRCEASCGASVERGSDSNSTFA